MQGLCQGAQCLRPSQAIEITTNEPYFRELEEENVNDFYSVFKL
jgi:hypothetical protein